MNQGTRNKQELLERTFWMLQKVSKEKEALEKEFLKLGKEFINSNLRAQQQFSGLPDIVQRLDCLLGKHQYNEKRKNYRSYKWYLDQKAKDYFGFRRISIEKSDLEDVQRKIAKKLRIAKDQVYIGKNGRMLSLRIRVPY